MLIYAKDCLKICDLGEINEQKIVNGVETAESKSGTGTPLYMSPEQVRLVIGMF